MKPAEKKREQFVALTREQFATLREQIATEKFATLTREQIAKTLGVCVDTLDGMHRRGEGPPRFRASPRRWAYSASAFLEWQREQQAAALPTKRAAR